MTDYLDEEERIMDEQSGPEKSISIKVFQKPISDLGPSRAITMDVDVSVQDAISKMQDAKIGSILITKDEKIAGIFTERDVLMKITGIVTNLDAAKVSEYMTPEPTCLRINDAIAYALHNMHFGGYRHVPIINDSLRPTAIVSIKDINNYLMDYFSNEIDNMMDEPFRGKSVREGA